MNNYEKIRNMTVEQLADFFDRSVNEDRNDWKPIGCYSCLCYGTHHAPEECRDCEFRDGIIGWLKGDSKI